MLFSLRHLLLALTCFFSVLLYGNPTNSNLRLTYRNICVHNPGAKYQITFTNTKTFNNGALKASLLENLRDYFGIDAFVETGTNLGNTAFVASQVFREVHSIEIFDKFFCAAQERFRNSSNVAIYHGDSAKLFPHLLSEIKGRALIYLDGHFDGGDSGKGAQNTPIIEELTAIKDANITTAVILIDDICDFQKSKFSQKIKGTCFENYPELSDLITLLLDINSDYQFCFLGNSLVAFPLSETVTLSPVLSACSIDRLSTISDLFSNEFLIKQEALIGSAYGAEKEELLYYSTIYSAFEWQYGWKSFSAFWAGLIKRHDGKYLEAKKLFKLSAHNSLPGWRVDKYI